jgi:SMODS and SLOG-associating 2TM effector domain 2
VSLQALADYVAHEAESAIRWYLRKKDSKRRWAQGLRFLAIFATALAGLIPLLAEIFETDGRPDIPPAWASVALLVAAACIGLDRFFGYSTAWMRFLTTEMEIRHALHDFLLDWEGSRAAREGKSDPGPEQAAAGLRRCKEFLAKINGILKAEMDTWVTEFSAAIADIDKAAKAQAEIMRLGAANLTVSNGEQCADGWRLSIDGGAEETRRGRSAALRNVVPGAHTVSVSGAIAGQERRAEQAFTVAAGETASVELTLA